MDPILTLYFLIIIIIIINNLMIYNFKNENNEKCNTIYIVKNDKFDKYKYK